MGLPEPVGEDGRSSGWGEVYWRQPTTDYGGAPPGGLLRPSPFERSARMRAGAETHGTGSE